MAQVDLLGNGLAPITDDSAKNSANNANNNVTESAAQARAKQVEAVFNETIARDKDGFAAVSRSASNSVYVSKVLGYTNAGSIVETAPAVGQKYLTDDKGRRLTKVNEKGEKEYVLNPDYVAHKVEAAPKNVGYIVKNLSDAPIAFKLTKSVWSDAEGKYLPEIVDAVIPAQGEAAMHKGDLTKLLSKAEFGGYAQNGHVKATPSTVKTDVNDIEALLGTYNFAFNADEAKTPDRLVQIGVQDAEGKWHVSDEYKEIFGTEENVVEVAKAPRQKKAADEFTGTVKDMNFLDTLLRNANIR